MDIFHHDENLSDTDKKCFHETRKTLLALISVFVAVLVLFFGVKTYNEIKSGRFIGQDIVPVNTINVGGKGEVFAVPDIAKISISVEKEAQNLNEAQGAATQAINNTIDFLKKSSVEDKDIKTTNYNIYPRYDYLEKIGRVFRGYVVSQTLEIKIRKTDEAGNILAGVTAAGATNVGGIFFVIDDENAVKREAKQKAIADAKEKAEQLAGDLGVKIVRIVSFSESGGDYAYFKAMDSTGYGIGGAEMSAPSIPTGENKITVNVNITYEIK